MSSILITGGKGVVGSSLAQQLRLKGHRVVVCDLKHSHEADFYRCDVAEYRQIQQLFRQHEFDYVYHLAAEFGRWNGEDFYEKLWMTNAVGTKNLLNLQSEYGFRMIFTSSSEVYGDYDGTMDEEVMNRLEIKQMNDYAMSKWVNEMQIANARAMNGNQVLIVRLFNTYGPGEYYTPYRSAICIFAYRALFKRPYTVYRNHTRSSLYIEDCTEAMADLMEHFVDGAVYNLAGTQIHSMQEVSDFILSVMGKDDRLVRYLDQEAFTTRNKAADVSQAQKAFGFQPKMALQEGIIRTVQWMREIYGI